MILRRFCSKVKAHVSGLPPHFDESRLHRLFNDKDAPVESITLLKNKLGQSAGRAIFEYKAKEHL